MTDVAIVAIVAVVAFGAGYLAARRRPLVALLGWAEDQTRDRPVRFWAAQPILAVALVAVFVTRPRRTLANIRAARAREAPVRAPAFDFAAQSDQTMGEKIR